MAFREAPKWLEDWKAYQGWQAKNEQQITQQELRRARSEAVDLGTIPDWAPAGSLPAVGQVTNPGQSGGGVRINKNEPRIYTSANQPQGGADIAFPGGAPASIGTGRGARGTAATANETSIVARGSTARAQLSTEQLFNRLRTPRARKRR